MSDASQHKGSMSGKSSSSVLVVVFVIAMLLVPLVALGVGFGILPRGGSFNPIQSGTALAANSECLLKFPPDASADDALIGSAIDQYIKSKVPSSPLVGLGSAISKSGRGSGINPTIIVSMARNESSFGTAGDTAISVHNPFGRRNTNGSYISFNSFADAIADQGPYLKRRYIDQGANTVLAMMNIYAPTSDGNDPQGYTRNIQQWSAEMILLAQQNYQNALGSGTCPTATGLTQNPTTPATIKPTVPSLTQTP